MCVSCQPASCKRYRRCRIGRPNLLFQGIDGLRTMQAIPLCVEHPPALAPVPSSRYSLAFLVLELANPVIQDVASDLQSLLPGTGMMGFHE